jgi:hypothetical protein
MANFIPLSLTGITMSLLAMPAVAHHSFAMFDREKTVQMQGTVKELELINPHGWLQLVVADPKGQESVWPLEMGGAGQLARQGWTESVKPGAKVTVSIHPLRDGSHGGQLVSLRLPDGRGLRQRPFGGGFTPPPGGF